MNRTQCQLNGVDVLRGGVDPICDDIVINWCKNAVNEPKCDCVRGRETVSNALRELGLSTVISEANGKKIDPPINLLNGPAYCW